MITLKESILTGMEETIARGQNDLDRAMGIPTIDDFYTPRSSREYSIVLWRCKDKLERYNNSWVPVDSPGITFMIYTDDACCIIESKITDNYLPNDQYKLAPPLHNKRIKNWKTVLNGKNRTYCKKVVLSLIKHLANNPKAFHEYMHYIAECKNHKSAEQSYHTGKSMPVRDFMELIKIKG